MNIIIVNEKKTEGGAEVYVKNLYKILKENGINVFIIYLNDSKEIDNKQIDEDNTSDNSKKANNKNSLKKKKKNK